MAIYFVSRHPGAHQWLDDLMDAGTLPRTKVKMLDSLDVSLVQPGDTVMGTLPVGLVAQVCARGARFVNLDLTVPPQWRGQELSPQQMRSCNATLAEYAVTRGRTLELLGKPERSQPKRTATIMLVGKEHAPQLIGYRMEPTDLAVLIISKEMHKQGKALAALLQGQAAKPKVISIQVPGTDLSYADWAKHANQLFQHLFTHRDVTDVIVNCTGGLKIMSTAYAEAANLWSARGYAVQKSYVDSESGFIDKMDTTPRLPIRSTLNAADLLACQGVLLESAYSAAELYKIDASRQDSIKQLLKLSSFEGLLGELNGTLIDLEKKADFLSDPAPKDIWVSTHLDRRLRGRLGQALAKEGVLRGVPEYQGPGRDPGELLVSFSLQPTTRSQRELAFGFLTGRWIEAWLGTVLEKFGFDDVLIGANISDAHGAKNEIDAVVVNGNQLLLIEAKTNNQRRSSPTGDGDRAAAQALYKVSSVGAKIARFFAAKWYVTARPLDAADLKRAESLNVRVFHVGEAAGREALEQALAQWARKTKRERHAGFERTQTEVPPKMRVLLDPVPRGAPAPGAAPTSAAESEPTRSPEPAIAPATAEQLSRLATRFSDSKPTPSRGSGRFERRHSDKPTTKTHKAGSR